MAKVIHTGQKGMHLTANIKNGTPKLCGYEKKWYWQSWCACLKCNWTQLESGLRIQFHGAPASFILLFFEYLTALDLPRYGSLGKHFVANQKWIPLTFNYRNLPQQQKGGSEFLPKHVDKYRTIHNATKRTKPTRRVQLVLSVYEMVLVLSLYTW